MAGQRPAAGQQHWTRTDANHLPHEESVTALYGRLEKLQYYRDIAKDKATALISEVQDLMNQYDYREEDVVKAALA